MKFTMTVEMDNDAFQDGNDRLELRRIMHKVSAKLIEHGNGDSGAVLDYNGNTVGEWAIREDES